MIRNRSLVAISLAVLAALARADLTASDKTEVVNRLGKEMIERYVVKAKGQAVADMLNENLKKGAYDSITDGAAFAKALGDHINAICGDAHLRVRYSPSVLPQRKEVSQPSAEEIAAQKRQTKLTNAGFEEVKRLGGNLGYIRFFGFFSPEDAARPIQAAMDFVKDTDALIFDIRDNGGGDPRTVNLLCSYLFDKPTHINDILFRRGEKTTTEKFVTRAVKGAKYLNKPIYVLVSKRTGSGAEEFAYDLQNQKRAVILGENTWGGANPGGTVRLNDHFSAFIPVGMARNPITGTNWEGTGVTPDVKISPKDALKEAQILAIKKLLETATGQEETRLRSVLEELKSGALGGS
ncbi:MAG: S41 family peptidase [Armatimonadetes bacterium]|nr:S41 family peptidase [Armatimonadota bacterium]